MTQEEFVNRWKAEVTGMACYGFAAKSLQTSLNNEAQGNHVIGVTENAQDLLVRIWHSMQPKPEPLPTKVTPSVAPNPPAKQPPPPVGPQATPQGQRR